MIDDFKQDAASRMAKTITALKATMAKIRTGRANANLLDGVNIEYYGVETPIGQAASICCRGCKNSVCYSLGKLNHPRYREGDNEI